MQSYGINKREKEKKTNHERLLLPPPPFESPRLLCLCKSGGREGPCNTPASSSLSPPKLVIYITLPAFSGDLERDFEEDDDLEGGMKKNQGKNMFSNMILKSKIKKKIK